MERRTLRAGAFGQHRGFSEHPSQSSLLARYRTTDLDEPGERLAAELAQRLGKIEPPRTLGHYLLEAGPEASGRNLHCLERYVTNEAIRILVDRIRLGPAAPPRNVVFQPSLVVGESGASVP